MIREKSRTHLRRASMPLLFLAVAVVVALNGSAPMLFVAGLCVLLLDFLRRARPK